MLITIISCVITGLICLVVGFMLGNWNYQFRVAQYKIIQLIWYLLNRVDDHSQQQILTCIKYYNYKGYKTGKGGHKHEKSL